MKQKKIWIAVLAGIVLIAVSVAAAAALGGRREPVYRSIKIVELKGDVSIDRGGVGTLAAAENMNLVSGDRVVTAKEAYVVLCLDTDKYVMLGEAGAMKVAAEGDGSSGKTSISLEGGSVLSEIQNPLGKGSSYEIVTPNATMSVRGTVFEVRKENEGDGQISVLVYDGCVAVGLGGKEPALYNAGEYTIFTGGAAPEALVERGVVSDEVLDGKVRERLQQISEGGRTLNVGSADLSAEAPAATEKPEVTGAPAVTEKPEVTEAPAVTEKPEVTEAPAATEKPEVTEAPAATEKPEVTEAPAVTAKPEVTEAPAVTAKPEVTEAPAVTAKPEAAATPAAAPVVTEAPAPGLKENEEAPGVQGEEDTEDQDEEDEEDQDEEEPEPTAAPTKEPGYTPKPTAVPTPKPTAPPTAAPTLSPTAAPTPKPTASPTATPTPPQEGYCRISYEVPYVLASGKEPENPDEAKRITHSHPYGSGDVRKGDKAWKQKDAEVTSIPNHEKLRDLDLKFVGWYQENGEEWKYDYYVVMEDLVLYPVWKDKDGNLYKVKISEEFGVCYSIKQEPAATPVPAPSQGPVSVPSPAPSEEPAATPSPAPSEEPAATPSPAPSEEPAATPGPAPSQAPAGES